MNKVEALSTTARRSIEVLGAEIQLMRRQRGWSEEELARRLGSSRKTVRAIESALPTVAIGYVFEAAQLVGIELFGGGGAISERLSKTRTHLELLPKHMHTRLPEIKDDF